MHLAKTTDCAYEEITMNSSSCIAKKTKESCFDLLYYLTFGVIRHVLHSSFNGVFLRAKLLRALFLQLFPELSQPLSEHKA